MRVVPRSASAAAILWALGACTASGPSQNAVAAGDLPAIRSDYSAAILAWARGFYAEPHGLRETAISDPLLRRDDTGRLVWLVCIAANARERAGGYTGGYMGVQRQAFGFAPNYMSSPLERNRSALTREDCDDPRLAYRPFPALARP